LAWPIAALAISFFFEKFAWGGLTTAAVALSDDSISL
jgi:hypothetical protein